MYAHYAEICRVSNLEADFQQVLLVQFFFEIVVKHQLSNLAKKNKKNIFLFQKMTLPKKLHRSDQFLAINLILGYIFENQTQKQKRQKVSDKTWSVRTKCFHLK